MKHRKQSLVVFRRIRGSTQKLLEGTHFVFPLPFILSQNYCILRAELRQKNKLKMQRIYRKTGTNKAPKTQSKVATKLTNFFVKIFNFK